MDPHSQDPRTAESDLDCLRLQRAQRAVAEQQGPAPQAPTVPQPVGPHAQTHAQAAYAAAAPAAPAAPQSVPAAPCAEPAAPAGWYGGAAASAAGPAVPPQARADLMPCPFSDSRVAPERGPPPAASAHAAAAAPPPSAPLAAAEPAAPAGWSAGATAAPPPANSWRQQAVAPPAPAAASAHSSGWGRPPASQHAAPPPPQPQTQVVPFTGTTCMPCTPPGALPSWMEFRGTHNELFPFCVPCSNYITEAHLLSEKHQRRVGQDGLEAALRAANHGPPPQWGGNHGAPPPQPPSWDPEAEGIRGPLPPPPLQAQAQAQAGFAGPPSGAPAPVAAAPAFGSAVVPWTSGAATGQYPEPLPPGQPEWYEWNPLQWKFYCKLCGSYADDGHVRSERHVKRAQYPGYYLNSYGGHSSHIGSAPPGPPALAAYSAWPSQAPAAAQPWLGVAPPAQGEPPPPTPSDLPPGWYANWEAMTQNFCYYQVDSVTGKWINLRYEKPAGGVLALTDGVASSVAQPAPSCAAAAPSCAAAAAPATAAAASAATAPSAAATAAAAARPVWNRYWSQEYSRYYYHNVGTGETTWSEPSAYEDAPARTAPVQAAPEQAATAAWTATATGAVHVAGPAQAAAPSAAAPAAQAAAAQAAPAASVAAAPGAAAAPAAAAHWSLHWEEHWAVEYNRPYWHNSSTGVSTWDSPFVDQADVDV